MSVNSIAGRPDEISRNWVPWGQLFFLGLVVCHLVPVWAFRYLPTQDGPHHITNAIILKDYSAPGTRYHEFFQLQWELFPNWTTQLLLAGLLHVLPPLAADKALASLYIVGFAYSFRYFLGAFGPEARQLAPAGLLFLFNRCFLMGFYNYCLSLVVYWLILGFCLRRRDTLSATGSLLLFGLFVLVYFTHLLGYALAVASACWVAGTSSGRRLANLGWVVAASLPTGILAVITLTRPGLLGLPEAAGAERGLLGVWGKGLVDQIGRSLDYIDDGLFSAYAGQTPMWLLVLLLFEILLMYSIFAQRRDAQQARFKSSRWVTFFLGAAIAILYLLVPDSFSLAIGFLKARLVILPLMLWLACFRLPVAPVARRACLGGVYLLIGLNLLLVGRHFRAANLDLVEYTSMVGQVGQGRTLFVDQSPLGPHAVNHLEHAADYYCLAGRNVNLDNFQATVAHFPVRFRPGVERGYGSFPGYRQQSAVQVIVVWNSAQHVPRIPPVGFRELQHRGRLTIYQRTGTE